MFSKPGRFYLFSLGPMTKKNDFHGYKSTPPLEIRKKSDVFNKKSQSKSQKDTRKQTWLIFILNKNLSLTFSTLIERNLSRQNTDQQS